LAQDRTAWVENIETMMKKMEEKDNILRIKKATVSKVTDRCNKK
jgi:hypothetical protein